MPFSRRTHLVASLGVLFLAVVMPLTARAVTIDATALTAPTFAIFPGAGGVLGPFATGSVQTLALGPDTYNFVDEVNGAFTFNIDAGGLITYDPAIENFLDGFETTNLKVRGLDVTIDASALTCPTYWVPHLFTYTSTSIVRAVTMLPGGPFGFADTGSNEVGFFLDGAGNVYYPASADEYFDGAGTPHLVVTGSSITIDCTALTSPTVTVAFSLPGPVSTASIIHVTDIQGIGYEVRDVLSNFFSFVLTPDGNVTYDPAFEAFLDGNGTPNLVVHGFTMTIDARGLPPSTFNLSGLINPGSTSVIHTFTGLPTPLPGGYLFAAAGEVLFFSIDLAGHYQDLPATFAGLPVSGNGTSTLRIGAPLVGSVTGRVAADCPAADSPLLGVRADIFEDGTGDLVGTAVTDANGQYTIADVGTGPHTVSLVTPLGYSAATADQAVAISGGQVATADFALHCLAATGSSQGAGFWKHQVGVATGGNGQAQVDAATLCSYLDLIAVHFNSNAVNPVVVYQPPSSGACADKLQVAKQLLNLAGSAAMIDRARQQLTALLLNVAAGFVRQTQVVSADGATASQAITWCDNLVDNPTGNHAAARTIAEMVNNGQQVPAGMIPLGTPAIAYGLKPGTPQEGDDLRADALELQIAPNPARAARAVRFAVGTGGPVSLAIYDVSGRRVADLYRGAVGPGRYSIAWDGSREGGEPLPQGLYFARLSTGRGTRMVKVVQTAP